MIKKLVFKFVFICTIALFISWALPNNDTWQEKVNPNLLQKAKTQAQVEFLVEMKEQADVSRAKTFKTKIERATHVFSTLKEIATKSQAPVIDVLKNENAEYKSFYVINAIYVKGDLALIQQLAEQTEVARIQNNTRIKVEETTENSEVELRGPNAIEWGIDMINADDVWAMGYTGQGVTVAGADTGYDWTHPALQSKYRGWNGDGVDAEHSYNWHDAIHIISPLANDTLNPCGLSTMMPCDDHNHGTHTMGTMVGEDGDNQIGVAPGAKWMACRNMERGNGALATYIECFEFFLAPTDSNNENPDLSKAPHVINNSWYCSEGEGCNINNWGMIETVVDNLKASGVMVVVSAGNQGSSCSSVANPPAIFENSFSIGATAIDDVIANFSSRGPVTVDGSNRMKPNVSAPGVGVRSSIRNGGYSSFNGTSMAGPHVAGLVALVLSANPALAGQVEVLEDIIEASAVKKEDEQCGSAANDTSPNNVYGHGRVDALAAVEMALEVTGLEDTPNATDYVHVYPNPTSTDVTFVTTDLIGKTTVEIFDASGKVLQSMTWDLTSSDVKPISLATYPTGVYFYKMINDGKIIQGKLIKE